MDNKFVQTQPDTYSVNHEDITIIVYTKPDSIIDLEVSANQFNLNKSSCIWYYRQKQDEFPHRCIPSRNLTDCYYL